MRHSIFRGLLLTFLVLLPAGDLTTQEEEGQHFVVEEASGDVAVWKQEPASGE